MKHRPNLVQQAQAELNAQEQNAQGQNALTPMPPTPQPATPGANNRVRAAAQVPLPVNRNNVLAAKRKVAREEPNIWNMNQGRSLFQLGPESSGVKKQMTVQAAPVLSPPVLSPPVLSPPVLSPPFASTSRRNRRRHNTTPGLARAQARKAEKLHAEIQRREAARKALLANNGLGNNPFSAIEIESPVNSPRNKRLAEQALKRATRAEKNENAFVSPVGLYGNNTFVENIGSKQKEMSTLRANAPEFVPGAAAAEAAEAAQVALNAAAVAANPVYNSSAARKAAFAAQEANNAARKASFAAQEVNNAALAAAREAALRAVRTSTINNSPAVSNAVVAAQLERNTLSNQNARIAAKQRVERYKLGILPEQQALRKSAAANAAAAAAAAAAHEAAFAKSGEGPDVYGCTPCDRKILEKLDTILDRSKPSNILGAIKGTGAFVVTQVGAALSDAEAALKLAQDKGSKKAMKVAELALKYAQKKLEQLKNALTLSDETKKKIAEALENVNKALKYLDDNKKNILGGLTAPIWGPIFVALLAAQKIIEGLNIVGSATYNYLKTVAVPAAKAAWSITKAKILSSLGLAKTWMNNTRKSIGKSLYNFGSGVGSRLSGLGSRLSTGTRGVRNYLSGRTKERARILRFIKYYAIQTGKKSINWNNLEETQMYNRWVRQLVETGMYESDAKLAIQNLLGGLSVNEVNGMVTAADGKAKVNPEAFVPPANLNYTRVKGEPYWTGTAEPAPRIPIEMHARPGALVEKQPGKLALSPIQRPEVAEPVVPLRRVAANPNINTVAGMDGGRKRSRKNRKSSRKSSRKNRKSSRRNRK
jgi:hypothetical protein